MFPLFWKDWYLIGYEDNINLVHTSAIDTYVMQCLWDNLGTFSSFYVKESCIPGYLNIGSMDLTIATIYGASQLP